MKMTPADYQTLATALADKTLSWPLYAKAGLSPTRYRWDCLHASGVNLGPLYVYLDDTHITTALRRLVPLS